MGERTIEEVQEAHTREWMAIRGVVGTGVGRCGEEPCIRVFVTRKTAEIERKIPATVEGYRIDIHESGRFEARDSS